MIKSETDTLRTAAPLNHGSLDRQAQRPSGEPGRGAHFLHRKAPGHATWLRHQSLARWPPLQAWERPEDLGALSFPHHIHLVLSMNC